MAANQGSAHADDHAVPLLSDPDPAKATGAADAMLHMDKLDMQRLQQAHAGPA